MLKINGREIGLYYSVWAHCEYNDWLLKNQEERSFSSGILNEAIIMSKAYCRVHGGTPLTAKEILDLPAYEFHELLVAVQEQEKADSVRTVEVEDSQEKNGESAAK